MAKHAKHSKEAKKHLKQRQKRLKKERKQQDRQDRGKGRGCLIAVLVVLIIALLLAALGAIVVLKPAFARPVLDRMQPVIEVVEPAIDQVLALVGQDNAKNEDANDSSEPAHATAVPSDAPAATDRKVDEEAQAKQAEQDLQDAMHQRRLIAQCQGVDIYAPISQDEITGVVFHQASYKWGQVMTTELPEADLSKIYDDGEYLRVNNEQTEGEWVDADAAHLYRETDATPMDTSIDCGAPAGSPVYAPVTGEVIAVQDYMLYDEIPDVQIHIRPDANRDLDVVLLHQTDPLVKVGDHVEAGQTQISSVRDIATDLIDVQLAFYTEPDDPGNHSHVQVNDIHDVDYLKKYFRNVPLDGIDTNFPDEEESENEDEE
ncbi:MAG: M23 family metallopeptidase [Eggerthellaceae bacterium]|nr:M23 family metallopeptidase [Eggerthellaceae bacterium]